MQVTLSVDTSANGGRAAQRAFRRHGKVASQHGAQGLLHWDLNVQLRETLRHISVLSLLVLLLFLRSGLHLSLDDVIDEWRSDRSWDKPSEALRHPNVAALGADASAHQDKLANSVHSHALEDVEVTGMMVGVL